MDIVSRFKEVHGEKYDYRNVIYTKMINKVEIICPEHGSFFQSPHSHLKGQGCSKCGKVSRVRKRTSTCDKFIERAKDIHGDKYDYSKVEYVNSGTKVLIICPVHGEFYQRPNSHLNGVGCPKCANEANGERCRLSKEEFIKKANEVHYGKYNYDKVEYKDAHTKVCVLCKDHGEFWQVPYSHLNGNGCPKCSGVYSPTTEEWIVSARKVHGDKYDYNKVEYNGAFTKVCIICPEHDHGEFWQIPNAHINGHGCPKCANEAKGEYCRLSKEDFIKKAHKVHGGKYYYDKVDYVNNNTKVCIICHKHGEFWQRPADHKRGIACPKCKGEDLAERYRLSKEEFIKKANEAHEAKYNYGKVKYENNHTKVCIICPEHEEFWQTPSNHLQGAGCPKCNLSHLERSVMSYLDDIGITYDYQKRFNWLGRQSLDFYLPDYKICIECQGEQHFFPVDFANKGIEWACKEFDKTVSRDKKKKKLCEKHGIKLLYFGNVPNYYTFLGEVVHDDVQYLIDCLKEHNN